MKPIPKVLITEDNRVSRAIISKIIKNLAYEVHVAENGEAAIELQKKCTPDLILLDVDMPGMDGYATCEILRNQCAQHVPILFLSGKNRKEDILKGYESGGNDFIVKPFEHEELSQKIKLAVEGKLEIDALVQKQSKSKGKSSLNIAALSEVAKLKQLTQFCQNSLACDNFTTVIEQFFYTLTHGLGLKGTLQIRLTSFSIVQSDDGVDRPLDLQVIQDYDSAGEISQFGANGALFSRKDCALLIRNIDQESEHVSILLDVFETALLRIDQRMNARKPGQSNSTTHTIEHILDDAFDKMLENVNVIFSNATNVIDEGDENRLLQIITEAKKHLLQNLL